MRSVTEGLRRQALLDMILICMLTAVLIGPWFTAGYTNNWGSIESTFIADARFLMEHWPHPQWQPLWYTGTRFDYVYPPALRYGTAAIAKISGVLPVQAYRFYTGFFYCLGIAGVYLLIRVGSRSRGAAWIGAAAAALTSPSFLILKKIRLDSLHWEPQRLGVLERYGEGPHMTALALIPFALAFTWLALQSRRWGPLACAAIFSAGIVANNFYGATALAIFYALLVFSLWITHREARILGRAVIIAALAYGLSAFWLTPSYLRITGQNMIYVAQPGNTWSKVLAVLVAVGFVAAAWKLARGRRERAWITFCAGCGVALTLLVAGSLLFDFRVGGQSGRWVPELDTAYILLAATFVAWLWKRSGWIPRAAAAVLVAGAFATSIGFVRHAWDEPIPFPEYQKRVEYGIQNWLWKNMPDARVHAEGSVRFWIDAWHDLEQMTGGSEQGLVNGLTMNARWEIREGTETDPAVLWMQALGVDVLYVSDPQSEEIYKDLKPGKFAGKLRILHDDERGNVLYSIPRRYAARARVVETARINAMLPPTGDQFVEHLRAYVDVVEHGPEAPTSLLREGTDAMVVRGRVEGGQSILVQETYDPAWQTSIGQIRKDALGFMIIDAPPGEQEVHLRFSTPLENRIGRLISWITVLILLAGLVFQRLRMSRGPSD